MFIQSLSDFISLNFKNQQIRTLLSEIRNQNKELIAQSYEIESFNEELHSLNEELSLTNETLEETVKKRTLELEMQNQQLTEYAFINSHLLRAPLSRIMGLSSLIANDATSVKDKQLVDALILSSDELDNIIRKISDVLYAGNNFSREDINVLIGKKINSSHDKKEQ